MIDAKVAGRYSFTPAQRLKWPRWLINGMPVWILTDGTQTEYDKLFQPANVLDYWKDSWGDPYNQPTIEPIINELNNEYEQKRQRVIGTS